MRIKAEDRASGTVHGTYDNIDVRSIVRTQADGSVRVSSTPPVIGREIRSISVGSCDVSPAHGEIVSRGRVQQGSSKP